MPTEWNEDPSESFSCDMATLDEGDKEEPWLRRLLEGAITWLVILSLLYVVVKLWPDSK